MESLRTLAAFALLSGKTIYGFDVERAYLEGTLDENVYVELPRELWSLFPKYASKVVKLQRALYGLPQSGRAWYHRFSEFIQKKGYKRLASDPCIYYHATNDIYIALYVDDGAVFATEHAEYKALCNELDTEFTVSRLGKITYSLGLQFEWAADNSSVILHQKTYTRSLVDRFSSNNKVADTPALPQGLDEDSFNKPQRALADAKLYRSILGGLMFVANATRPDIAPAVNRVARYMQRPLAGHIEAVQRILRYLDGADGLGVCYSRHGNIHPFACTDSNLGGDNNHERSRGGHVIMLADGPVLWKFKLQASTATSSCEAEYIQTSEATKDVQWIRGLITEIKGSVGVNIPATKVMCNNTATIYICKNPQASRRTRHIQLQHRHVRKCVEEDVVKICYVPSEDNIADLATKPLARQQFVKHTEALTVAATGGVKKKVRFAL